MTDLTDDLLSNFDDENYNIDLGLIAVKSLKYAIHNNEMLKAILFKQFELQILVQSTQSDVDDSIKEEFLDLTRKINETAEKAYYDIISKATK